MNNETKSGIILNFIVVVILVSGLWLAGCASPRRPSFPGEVGSTVTIAKAKAINAAFASRINPPQVRGLVVIPKKKPTEPVTVAWSYPSEYIVVMARTNGVYFQTNFILAGTQTTFSNTPYGIQRWFDAYACDGSVQSGIVSVSFSKWGETATFNSKGGIGTNRPMYCTNLLTGWKDLQTPFSVTNPAETLFLAKGVTMTVEPYATP